MGKGQKKQQFTVCDRHSDSVYESEWGKWWWHAHWCSSPGSRRRIRKGPDFRELRVRVDSTPARSLFIHGSLTISQGVLVWLVARSLKVLKFSTLDTWISEHPPFPQPPSGISGCDSETQALSSEGEWRRSRGLYLLLFQTFPANILCQFHTGQRDLHTGAGSPLVGEEFS